MSRLAARLFVCTTCDRYALPPPSPTRGEAMLAAVRAAQAHHPRPAGITEVSCVTSCPRPCGAAVREGPGGWMFRFVLLAPEDAPALVDFAARRAAGEDAPLPPALSGKAIATRLPERRRRDD